MTARVLASMGSPSSGAWWGPDRKLVLKERPSGQSGARADSRRQPTVAEDLRLAAGAGS